MSVGDERLAVQGPRGPQGNRGEQGTAGLSAPVRRALVFMFALFILLVAANFLWSARQQDAYEANLHREHAAHVRSSQLVIDKLCLTFGKLGSLTPPPGDPVKNPSRAYEQEQHDTLVQLGTDLGCRAGGP